MEKCVFCACNNHFYDENHGVDDDTATEVIKALFDLNEKFPSQPRFVQPQNVINEVDQNNVIAAEDDSDCLRWRCWRCNDVWRADQVCAKCKVGMADFEGDDLESIIVTQNNEEESKNNASDRPNDIGAPVHKEVHQVQEMTEDEILQVAASESAPTDSQNHHEQPAAQGQQEEEKVDKWSCEVCTYENTVTDWNNLDQSKCEVCEHTNENIRAVIQSQKKEDKLEAMQQEQ